MAEAHGATDVAAVTEPADRAPITRFAECVTETVADLETLGPVGAATGHVGDGNFLVAVLVDPDSPDERRNAREFTRRLALRAIAMDGTCTGAHGIGQAKMACLEVEAATALGAMRAIKRALDPLNIMNPGEIFGPDGFAGAAIG